MPSRGQTITVTFVAWDNTNNVGKTGDAANFTLRWVKDGTSAVPTNVPATEVDATNAPGLYKIVLTGTECTCDFGCLGGKSSTSGISIIPTSVAFEQLPTSTPGGTNGVFIAGSNATTTANITGSLSGSVGSVTGAVGSVTGAVGSVAGNVGGNVAGTVASVTGATGSVAGNVGGDVAGKVLGGGAGTISGAGVRADQVTGAVGSVTGAVGSVTGSVGGNVTGSVGSIAGVAFPANFGALSIDTSGNIKIQGSVKKNTALAGFQFYVALASDHVSPATGKSITATRSLNGGAFQACAAAATEIGAGWYTIDLAAGDLNGNTVALSFAAPASDTTVLTLVTQP